MKCYCTYSSSLIAFLLSIFVSHNAQSAAFITTKTTLTQPFLLNPTLSSHEEKTSQIPSISSLLSPFSSHHYTRTKYNKRYQSNNDNDVSFQMPSTDKLISDLSPSERGIGVGIDLGTTNSAISILNEAGIPQIIPINGKNTIPSVVSLISGTNNDGSHDGGGYSNIIVGIDPEIENENELITTTPENTNNNEESSVYTYRHVKRIIGMGVTSAASSADMVPHLSIHSSQQRKKGKNINKLNKKEGMASLDLKKMLKEAKKNPARLKVPRGFTSPFEYSMDHNMDGIDEFDQGVVMGEEEGDGTISPEFISAMILKKLLETVEEETGEIITRAVIGVPAYFNDAQREATLKATTVASRIPRERIRLLREPEAAALAYGIGKRQIGKGDDDELVLVFDLGGGTFDVSILEVGGGIYEVIATSGNNMLGGTDFDVRIAQYWSRIMMDVEGGCTRNFLKEGKDVADVMVTCAEQVRIALSNNKEVTLALPLSEELWMELEEVKDVVVSNNVKEEMLQEDIIIDENGSSNSTHVIFKLTRNKMESLCIEEFQALLRPVREVAIMTGAQLPGDSSPSAVEALLQMEEEMEQNEAAAVAFEAFFDEESGEAKEENLSTEMLLQLQAQDLKTQKKTQQRGRKRARNLRKDERNFRAEKRKAKERSVSSSSKSNIKVRDGINGRRITQVVLVGGSTRMPAIGRLLASVTGVVPQKTVNPDEAVSLGCAVQVGILDGINTELQVLTPIEAAMMRAMAKKRGLDVEDKSDDDTLFFEFGNDEDFDAEFDFGEDVEIIS